MTVQTELAGTASAMVAPGRGILAALTGGYDEAVERGRAA